VRKRLLFFLLIFAGCTDSGHQTGGAVGGDSSNRPAGRAVPAAAFRIPAEGGPLAVYALPHLDSTPWGAGGRLDGASAAVGVDLIGRRLLFRDPRGAIASFDLVSLREKTIGPRHAAATIAADGALLVVDASGGVTESQTWGTRAWPGSLGRGVHAVFAAPGPQLIAVRHTRHGDTLQVAGREGGVATTLAVPAATDIAASRDGDAVAFATDSGVVVYEDRAMDAPWFVRLSARPRALAFSPSGHRLYVALDSTNGLAEIDRFARKLKRTIDLPGPAGDVRPDPFGRVILVRAADAGDDGETWVVGVAADGVIGSLHGGWASDLPTVSESGVLLSREGRAVVARDVHSLDSLGAVAGGARDIWFAGRWVPSSAAASARVDAMSPESAAAGRTPALAPAPTTDADRIKQLPAPERAAPAPAPNPAKALPAWVAPPPSFFAQLLATRSEEAARALAANLAPVRAQVVAPRPGAGDVNWRVMVGPFRTREAADSAGRTIGRPYWVVDRSRDAGGQP